MTDLPTLLAELEEALKAANLNGDDWVVRYENIGPDDNPYLIAFLEEGSDEARILCIDEDPRGEDLPSPTLHFIALMRNSLPTLIEALKRQGEALEKIAAGQFPETPDDADMLDMAISGRRHMMALARAALTAHKEKSDV